MTMDAGVKDLKDQRDPKGLVDGVDEKRGFFESVFIRVDLRLKWGDVRCP